MGRSMKQNKKRDQERIRKQQIYEDSEKHAALKKYYNEYYHRNKIPVSQLSNSQRKIQKYNTKMKNERRNCKSLKGLLQPENKVKDYKKLMERYKKRLFRLKKNIVTDPLGEVAADVASIIEHVANKDKRISQPALRKIETALECGQQVTSIVKEGCRKEKQIIAKCFSLRQPKRGQKAAIKAIFGVGYNYKKTSQSGSGRLMHNIGTIRSRNEHLFQVLGDWWHHDDNSTQSTRIQDTVVSYENSKKTKRIKRFMTDTIQALYSKFCEQYPLLNVKKSTFYKSKPFYVVKPTDNDRQAVMCMKHENVILLAKTLKKLKLITFTEVHVLLKFIVCDIYSKECCFRNCPTCKENALHINLDAVGTNSIVEYEEWEKNTEVHSDGRNCERIKKTRKQLPISELVNKLNSQLATIAKHHLTFIHQIKAARQLRNKLMKESCSLRIDFSESHSLQYGTEVAGCLYGASKVNLSIHQGILSILDGITLSNISFASLSLYLKHDATAIWAYLVNILQYIKVTYPHVSEVILISDGPYCQYKNKTCVFFATTIPFLLGFKSLKWVYMAANHGKSAADGVGASIKCALRRYVNCGNDAATFEQVLTILNNKCKNIKIFAEPVDVAKLFEVKYKFLVEHASQLKKLDCAIGSMHYFQSQENLELLDSQS